MTTTPEETHMPTDPAHRALLRAIDGLTTQVRRIADTLETPVTTDDDGAQTTGDDTPTTRENVQLRAELDRIRRALDPDDETYIQETVDDQLAMTATINRVRKLHEPVGLLCRACATRAPCPTLVALDGQTAEG